MLDKASSYALYPSQMNGGRLDFVFHHPGFEPIRTFRASLKVVCLGQIISSPEYGISASGASDGNFPFINVQHILEYSRINTEPGIYVSECDEEKRLRPRDIIIARTGFSLGKAAVIPPQCDGYAFGSFCLRFRIEDPNYSEEYIVRFLNSTIGKNQTLMLRTGSDKPNINSDQIKDMRIPECTPDDQASILESVFEIEHKAMSLEKSSACLRVDLMREFERYIKLDAPASKEIPFIKYGKLANSIVFTKPFNEIEDRLHCLFYHPNYWEAIRLLEARYKTTSLSQIVSQPIVRGAQPEYSEEGEVFVIKTIDIKDNGIDIENVLKVEESFLKSNPDALVLKGDVLIASTGYGSLGKIAVYEGEEPALADGHVCILRLSKDYDPYFVSYYLQTWIGTAQFDRWFSGASGQIEIQPGDLGKFIIPISSKRGISLRDQQNLASEMREKLKSVWTIEAAARSEWEESVRVFDDWIKSIIA